MTQDILNKYGDIIAMAEAQTGVPADLIAAQIKQESGGNPGIFSPAGAGGLMQLMPDTAAGLGVTDVTDPEQNIMGGATYLAQMLDMFNGDVPTALAAYNAGPGNVKKYGGIPPFKETQNYVNSILGNLGQTQAPQQKKITGSLDDYLDTLDNGNTATGGNPGVPSIETAAPTKTDAKDLDSYLEGIDLGGAPAPVETPVETKGQNRNLFDPSRGRAIPEGSSSQWLPESILSGLGVNTVAKKIAETDTGKALTKSRNQFEAAGENAVVNLLDKGFRAFGITPKRGADITPEQVAQRSAGVKAESNASVKANPIKSMITQALAFQAGPGQVLDAGIPAPITGGSKLLNAAKIVGGGAAQGAGYEAVTNPDATASTIGTAGLIGGGVSGTLAGGANATKYLADKISSGVMGKFLGIKNPGVIQKILDEPGLVSPSTVDGFTKKVQKFVDNKESELQSILTKSDVKVNVKDVLNTALKTPESPLGKVLQTEIAATGKQPKNGFALLQQLIKDKGAIKGLTKVEKKVLDLAQHGEVPVSRLNELKRVFWKLARFKKSGDPSKEMERAIGEEFKLAIEKSMPNSPIAKINSQMGAGIETLDHLASKKGDVADKILDWKAVLLPKSLGVPKAAYNIATKTGLGATTTASTFKAISKLAKDRPELRKLLSTILPQAFK